MILTALHSLTGIDCQGGAKISAQELLFVDKPELGEEGGVSEIGVMF